MQILIERTERATGSKINLVDMTETQVKCFLFWLCVCKGNKMDISEQYWSILQPAVMFGLLEGNKIQNSVYNLNLLCSLYCNKGM